jgi:hypothetical protein
MQGLWRVTIKYVNIRIIYTLYKVVHSRINGQLKYCIDTTQRDGSYLKKSQPFGAGISF